MFSCEKPLFSFGFDSARNPPTKNSFLKIYSLQNQERQPTPLMSKTRRGPCLLSQKNWKCGGSRTFLKMCIKQLRLHCSNIKTPPNPNFYKIHKKIKIYLKICGKNKEVIFEWVTTVYSAACQSRILSLSLYRDFSSKRLVYMGMLHILAWLACCINRYTSIWLFRRQCSASEIWTQLIFMQL